MRKPRFPSIERTFRRSGFVWQFDADTVDVPIHKLLPGDGYKLWISGRVHSLKNIDSENSGEAHKMGRAAAATKVRDEEDDCLARLNALNEWDGNLWSKIAEYEWLKPQMYAQVYEFVKSESSRDVASVEYATHKTLCWVVLQQRLLCSRIAVLAVERLQAGKTARVWRDLTGKRHVSLFQVQEMRGIA